MPLQGKLFIWLRDIVMGLAPFSMEDRVGLYNISPKISIVEECNSDADRTDVDINDVDVPQSSDKSLSWADIVMKNKKSLGKFT